MDIVTPTMENADSDEYMFTQCYLCAPMTEDEKNAKIAKFREIAKRKKPEGDDPEFFKVVYLVNSAYYRKYYVKHDEEFPIPMLKDDLIPNGYKFNGWRFLIEDITKPTNFTLNEPLYAVADLEKIEAPKATNDLSTYQLSELLTFRDANGIVMSYYDNLVKSCTGNYDAATKSKYGEWMKMRTTYQNLDLKILEEIENRVKLLL